MISQKQPQTNQSGFTIIECLMAIIVVGALMTAIAPVIAISVATRLQAKRVEAGTQAAKNYIDGVRGGAIEPPNHTVVVDEFTPETTPANPYTSQRAAFSSTAAPANTSLSTSCVPPTSTTPPPIYPYCQNIATASLYCVDLDDTPGCSNTSTKDLIVQGFRSVYRTGTSPVTTVNAPEKGYLLGVRVYRASAFRNDGALFISSTNTNKRVIQGTAGGDVGVRSRKAPLVELTTEIPPSSGTSFESFCDRLGSKDSSGNSIACP